MGASSRVYRDRASYYSDLSSFITQQREVLLAQIKVIKEDFGESSLLAQSSEDEYFGNLNDMYFLKVKQHLKTLDMVIQDIENEINDLKNRSEDASNYAQYCTTTAIEKEAEEAAEARRAEEARQAEAARRAKGA